MRPVLMADLEQAARVLLAVPEDQWQPKAAEILSHAHTADLFRKRTGKRHPHWGNGTIADVCQSLPRRPQPYPATRPFHRAMAAFLSAYLHQNP